MSRITSQYQSIFRDVPTSQFCLRMSPQTQIQQLDQEKVIITSLMKIRSNGEHNGLYYCTLFENNIYLHDQVGQIKQMLDTRFSTIHILKDQKSSYVTGFSLEKNNNKYTFQITEAGNNRQKQSKTWVSNLRKYTISDLDMKSYIVEIQLGKGSSAQVFTIQKISKPRKVYALKAICKKNSQEQQLTVIQEIIHLQELSQQKNIIRLKKIIETKDLIGLFLELKCGGNLGALIDLNVLDEQSTKVIFRQILNGIRNIHEKGIVHRDIKPENILLPSKFTKLKSELQQTQENNDIFQISICDFGLAVTLNGQPQTTIAGTPGYIAPEVLQGQALSTKADLFSAGMILFNMITGKIFFQGTIEKVLAKNMNFDLSMIQIFSMKFPMKIQSLLQKLLDPNPLTRWSAEKAFRHSWFDDLKVQGQDGETHALKIRQVAKCSNEDFTSKVQHLAGIAKSSCQDDPKSNQQEELKKCKNKNRRSCQKQSQTRNQDKHQRKENTQKEFKIDILNAPLTQMNNRSHNNNTCQNIISQNKKESQKSMAAIKCQKILNKDGDEIIEQEQNQIILDDMNVGDMDIDDSCSISMEVPQFSFSEEMMTSKNIPQSKRYFKDL